MNLNDYTDDDILHVTTNICIEELERHIKVTKLRKAPGIEKVAPELILHGRNTLYIYLRHLFNMMIKCAYIRKDCKVGVIIPISGTLLSLSVERFPINTSGNLL